MGSLFRLMGFLILNNAPCWRRGASIGRQESVAKTWCANTNSRERSGAMHMCLRDTEIEALRSHIFLYNDQILKMSLTNARMGPEH